MYDLSVIENTARTVRSRMQHEPTGHDWWHVYRVWNVASRIAKQEKADPYIVELGALLHDIADHKFHGGDHSAGPRIAEQILQENGVEEKIVRRVCEVIGSVSFSKGQVPDTIEGRVVQDADRLDALGAIGIARCFAYSGNTCRPIHDPDLHEKQDKASSHATGHFYEKLLLLKDRMNTAAGKRMAQDRHAFIEQYLNRFFSEWEGSDL